MPRNFSQLAQMITFSPFLVNSVNSLSGSSKCVEGETFRLTLYVPEGYGIANTDCGEKTAFTVDGCILKVDINSVRSGDIAWKLNF